MFYIGSRQALGPRQKEEEKEEKGWWESGRGGGERDEGEKKKKQEEGGESGKKGVHSITHVKHSTTAGLWMLWSATFNSLPSCRCVASVQHPQPMIMTGRREKKRKSMHESPVTSRARITLSP